MAFNYSPRVVTDGLVMYLDAANPRSYSGSGTIWKDLSRAGYNATIANGPVYSSSNYGIFLLDGVDDIFYLPNIYPTVDQEITVSFWIYFNVIYGYTIQAFAYTVEQPFPPTLTYLLFYRNAFWDDGQLSFLISYVRTNSTSTSRQHFSPIGYFSTGRWYNITLMYDNTGRSKFYVNGEILVEEAPDPLFLRWVNINNIGYFALNALN